SGKKPPGAMILVSSDYGSEARPPPEKGLMHASPPPFCFGCTTVWATYIGSRGVSGSSRPTSNAARGGAPKGNENEHRTIHRQRSEVERRRAVHEGHAAISAVRFLRPGGADPRPHRRRL